MEESQSKMYFGIFYVRSKVVLYTELMNSQFWVVQKLLFATWIFLWGSIIFLCAMYDRKWGDESVYKISVDVGERTETQIKLIISLTKK